MSRDARLRLIPSTDRVLRHPEVSLLSAVLARDVLVRMVREAIETERQRVVAEGADGELTRIVDGVLDRAALLSAPLRRVINATGVVLHTNLGRAPLSHDAVEAMLAASGYTDVEFDLSRNERGSRQAHVSEVARVLLRAEAAHVTVNAASALLLSLTALAKGREVIVSRGQSVEIGGGFRIPEIMQQSGARVVEVGTTNRTRLDDYERAIGPNTAAILHVHSSNFRVIGFTSEVHLADLATLAHAHNLVLIDDNGSGSLVDTSDFGLSHEPMPAESIGVGADIVVFSGDKLLGGPQAGIIAGRAQRVQDIAGHPLARALRPDKTILAGLAATLRAYLRGDALRTVPIWQMISQSSAEIRGRAEQFAERAGRRGISLELVDGVSTVGGGSLPTEVLPTVLLRLPENVKAARLLRASPPVAARVQDGRSLLDLRTVPLQDESALLQSVLAAGTSEPTQSESSGTTDLQ